MVCDVAENADSDLIDLGVTYFKCDISDSIQVEDLFKKIKNKFNRLDCLIANAGIVGPVDQKLGNL